MSNEKLIEEFLEFGDEVSKLERIRAEKKDKITESQNQSYNSFVKKTKKFLDNTIKMLEQKKLEQNKNDRK